MAMPISYNPDDAGLIISRYLWPLAMALGLAAVCFISFGMFLVGGILMLFVLLPFAFYALYKCPDILVFLALLVNYTPVPHNYGNLIILATTLALILGRSLSGEAGLKIDLVVILWLVMAGLAFITVPKWNSLSLGVKGLHRAFMLPLSIYILFTQRYISDGGIRRFLRIYIPVLVIYVLAQVAVVFLATNVNVASHWQAVHAGFDLEWGKSNTIAATMVLFIALLYSSPQLKDGTFLKQVLIYSLMGLSLIFTAVIVSRGAILSLLMGITLYAAIEMYLKKKINLGKVLGYGSIAMALFLFFLRKPLLNYIDRFSNLKVDVSTFARLYMIRDTLLTIKDNLLVGIGPSQKMYTDFYAYHNNPHNAFLQYGAELGVLGMVVLAILFAIPYYRVGNIIRIDPDKGKVLLGLFFLPLTVAVINSQGEAAITLYNYGLVYWIYYSICMKMVYDVESGKTSGLIRPYLQNE